ncbi:MAG: diadenylate cyclase CdaA [Clostridia bacterium]|nr:diadenylate cyclase CdaA [Clostridia bacterium]MBQ8165099.1 diadenylate cyclase CdaA [Clostridia bacterium]
MGLILADSGGIGSVFIFLGEYLGIESAWDIILILLDLTIVSYAVFKIIQLFHDSRAKQVGKGILLILLIASVANLMNLTAVSYIVNILVSILPVTIVVLFQTEIKRIFEGVGHTKLRDYFHPDKNKENEATERVIDEIIVAVEDLAENRVGALLVFERQTNLGEVISSGTIIDANVTSALIRQIFVINTPLHDGATVIRNNRIYASGCFLPLTTDSSLNKELGTRHRAGIGVTEISDCITLIVSEETGIISCAQNGSLTRNMDSTMLKRVLSDNLMIKDKEKDKETESDKKKRFFRRRTR